MPLGSSVRQPLYCITQYNMLIERNGFFSVTFNQLKYRQICTKNKSVKLHACINIMLSC